MNKETPSEGEDSDDLAVIPEQLPWSRGAQAIAAILWPSFLAAGLATMLFFAFVDPESLRDTMVDSLDFGRMSGYGLGFFFFWLVTLVSSAISVFLLRTARRNGSSPDKES